MREIFKFTVRSAIWKTTPEPPVVGSFTLIACTLLSLASVLILEYFNAEGAVYFSSYGLNADFACLVVILAVSSFFIRPRWRATVVSAIALLGCIASLVSTAAVLAQRNVPWSLAAPWLWTTKTSATLAFLVYIAWWLGAVAAMYRSIEPKRRLALVRAFALWVVLLAVALPLPYYPTFRGEQFDVRTANYWEYVSAYLHGRLDDQVKEAPRAVDGDEIDLLQAALLDEQLSRLSLQTSGQTDVYAIGMAGWGEQDVFLKELRGGFKSLSRVLPLDGRVIELVNNPDTAEAVPLASRQNFSTAVRAVARVMDREEDILLLFMTSHGSSDGLALSLRGAVYGDLSPTQVAEVLDREHIKNRLIIVSACYSGVFVKPLANEHTIILTAADESSTSFGCSNDRDWTYFGDALFNHGLDGSNTLEEAFARARSLIGEWETRDKLTPSNPQAQFGPALEQKLGALYRVSTQATNPDGDR
jgi:hypothetical protein